MGWRRRRRPISARARRELSLSEAALLAALPKAPTRLAPGQRPGRRHRPLQAGARRHAPAPAGSRRPQQKAALAAPPRLRWKPAPVEGDFGYVLDLAAQERPRSRQRQQHARPRGAPDRRSAACRPKRRRRCAMAWTGGRRRARPRPPWWRWSRTGRPARWWAAADHRALAFDRATQALRQPGSTFKPFVYAAALEARGEAVDDVRTDSPVHFGGWSPQPTTAGISRATSRVADALARSINTVAVRLAHQVGAGQGGGTGRALRPDHDPAPPRACRSALGAYEVDAAGPRLSAYQVFQQDGRKAPSIPT